MSVKGQLLLEYLLGFFNLGFIHGRGRVSSSFLYLSLHLVDRLHQLLNQLIFLTDLTKHPFNLLECVPTDHFLDSPPHLPHCLLVLPVPLLTHSPQFILQGGGFVARGVDIEVQLLQFEVVLVVVMHFTKGLLAVKLGLGRLGLNLQLVNL